MAATAPDDNRITQALRQLDSNRPPAVAKAAQQLLKLAPGDPRIEEILCRRLSDPCLRVRAIVASALGELKNAKRVEPSAGSFTLVATSLAGKVYSVKVCPSYNVLGLKEVLAQAIKTTSANLMLMLDTTILEDAWVLKDHNICEDTLISFALCSEAEAKPDASIEPLIQRLDDNNERCKMEALTALARMAPDNLQLVEPLLRCLQREFSRADGGSLPVSVAIAKLLFRLEPYNAHFATTLMNGLHQELQSYRFRQFLSNLREHLSSMQLLNSLAEMLAQVAPGDFHAMELIHYFLIFRIRVLGCTPEFKSIAPEMVRQLGTDEPGVQEALLKILHVPETMTKRGDYNMFVNAVNFLRQVPIEDLRLVEALILSGKEPLQRRKVRHIVATAPNQKSSILQGEISFQGEASEGKSPLPPDHSKTSSATNQSGESDQVHEDNNNREIPDSWDECG